MKSCLATWNRKDRTDLRVYVSDDAADLYVLKVTLQPRHVLLIDTTIYGDIVAWGDGIDMAILYDSTY